MALGLTTHTEHERVTIMKLLTSSFYTGFITITITILLLII